MKREIYQDLLKWKEDKERLPLMLLGARQVGKTYILKEFCEKEYNNAVYINLMEHREIVETYKKNISSEDKFKDFKLVTGSIIENEESILFIDEIQECEELISELKFFCENYPKMNIVCAGSLLGVKIRTSNLSFPVGKVSIYTLYPMNFKEFLLACDENLLLSGITECFNDLKPMSEMAHSRAVNLYREFLCIGGMPGVVKDYINKGSDLSKINKSIIKSIIDSYIKDMNKYVENNSESVKTERTYKSICSQVGSETKKFVFSKIDKNSKRRDYETSMDWLLASNIVLEATCVSTPEVPLKVFLEPGIFKMYLSDVGILNSILEIKFFDIKNDSLSLFKGAITKNYVATELICNNHNLHYLYQNKQLEIDFLLYTKDGIVPVEVKAGINTKSESLKKYINLYKPKYGIRISLKNFGYHNNIKSIPLYATFLLVNE